MRSLCGLVNSEIIETCVTRGASVICTHSACSQGKGKSSFKFLSNYVTYYFERARFEIIFLDSIASGGARVAMLKHHRVPRFARSNLLELVGFVAATTG